MNTRSLTVLVAGLVVAMSAAAGPRAEALELEDKERAQLAKETLKQKRGGKTGKQTKSAGDNSGCGTIDIGNSDSDKKGSGRIAERDKTVIVTGNVYNTPNCRR